MNAIPIPHDPLPASPGVPGEVKESGGAEHPITLLLAEADQSHGYRRCLPPPPVFPGEGRGGGQMNAIPIRQNPLPASPGVPGEVKESGGAEHAITQLAEEA
jgi:hypothetical protein